MITFEEMLEGVEDPAIQMLKTEAFSNEDVVNLILQRSEILRDQPRPGRAINAWVDGDHAPALDLVERMREDLIKRAAAVIMLEYQEIRRAIGKLAPKRVADIGCGYAIWDLFLWRDFQADLLLIDLEASDERHFGYRETGAAYSNLEVAQRFLSDNGVPEVQITCQNPDKHDLSEGPGIDLAVSFISCGFHYPIDTYMPFFETRVRAGGGVIVDFRGRKAREGVSILKALGEVETLTDAAYGNAKRVMLTKR